MRLEITQCGYPAEWVYEEKGYGAGPKRFYCMEHCPYPDYENGVDVRSKCLDFSAKCEWTVSRPRKEEGSE